MDKYRLTVTFIKKKEEKFQRHLVGVLLDLLLFKELSIQQTELNDLFNIGIKFFK